MRSSERWATSSEVCLVYWLAVSGVCNPLHTSDQSWQTPLNRLAVFCSAPVGSELALTGLLTRWPCFGIYPIPPTLVTQEFRLKTE